jgi:hypothetical protein
VICILFAANYKWPEWNFWFWRQLVSQLNRPLVLWVLAKMTSQNIPDFIVQLSVKDVAGSSKKEKAVFSLLTVAALLLLISITKSAAYPNSMLSIRSDHLINT